VAVEEAARSWDSRIEMAMQRPAKSDPRSGRVVDWQCARLGEVVDRVRSRRGLDLR